MVKRENHLVRSLGVKEHLSEYQNFLVEQGFRFDETRWFGVGAFSNQGSEHMNKVLKRRLLRNAMKNSWKYFQGLNGQIILTLHNYGKQVEQEPFCLRCNQLGHQRTTHKDCLFYNPNNEAHNKLRQEYKLLFKSAEEDVQRIPVGPISILPTYHESQLNETQNINLPTPERTDMFQIVRNSVSNNSLDQEQDTNQNPTQTNTSNEVTNYDNEEDDFDAISNSSPSASSDSFRFIV